MPEIKVISEQLPVIDSFVNSHHLLLCNVKILRGEFTSKSCLEVDGLIIRKMTNLRSTMITKLLLQNAMNNGSILVMDEINIKPN